MGPVSKHVCGEKLRNYQYELFDRVTGRFPEHLGLYQKHG